MSTNRPTNRSVTMIVAAAWLWVAVATLAYLRQFLDFVPQLLRLIGQ